MPRTFFDVLRAGMQKKEKGAIMDKNKLKKPQYSAAEKRAYYIGVGAAVGMGNVKNVKRYMGKLSPLEKQSFKNGFDDHLTKRK